MLASELHYPGVDEEVIEMSTKVRVYDTPQTIETEIRDPKSGRKILVIARGDGSVEWGELRFVPAPMMAEYQWLSKERNQGSALRIVGQKLIDQLLSTEITKEP